jgi:hypothetical protein
LYKKLSRIKPHIKSMIFDIATVCEELDEEANNKVFHYAMMLYKINLKALPKVPELTLLKFEDMEQGCAEQETEKAGPQASFKAFYLLLFTIFLFWMFSPLSMSGPRQVAHADGIQRFLCELPLK